MTTERPPRARHLGIPFEGTPGPLNAITDVAGVEVGYTTLIQGEGPLVMGQGPVRTGVTIILPRGKRNVEPVYASYSSFNGAGEMTGILNLEEWGWLYGPIGVTNTHSVGVVRDALVNWNVRNGVRQRFHCPLVAETFDGKLNDVNGFHVKTEHVFSAIDRAASGPLEEGNVGGGTGMILHGWKGGTGTASRLLPPEQGGYTVGVLVQGNYGGRQELRIAGAPIGREISEPHIELGDQDSATSSGRGSIIVIVATDAPLVPHQLKRVAKRPTLALGRMGSKGHGYSGDIFMAFSTLTPRAVQLFDEPLVDRPDALYEPNREARLAVETLSIHGLLSAIFAATVEATEEAIVNAMVAAEDMRGANGNFVPAIPHDSLRAALRKYNLLVE